MTLCKFINPDSGCVTLACFMKCSIKKTRTDTIWVLIVLWRIQQSHGFNKVQPIDFLEDLQQREMKSIVTLSFYNINCFKN